LIFLRKSTAFSFNPVPYSNYCKAVTIDLLV
jgi:hypothetical protein